MGERRFEVLNGNNVLASNMQLEDALLFINAIFDKYYFELYSSANGRERIIPMSDNKSTLADIKSGKGLPPINTQSNTGSTSSGLTLERSWQNSNGFRVEHSMVVSIKEMERTSEG